jgi:hypothetical protein
MDIYMYSLDRITKEAIAEVYALRGEAANQGTVEQGAILLCERTDKKPEIKFDVSILDYETKHEMDIKIRKILKRHGIKFVFSNKGNPKLNFYYNQKQ